MLIYSLFTYSIFVLLILKNYGIKPIKNDVYNNSNEYNWINRGCTYTKRYIVLLTVH